jgi:hypothetical protein
MRFLPRPLEASQPAFASADLQATFYFSISIYRKIKKLFFLL